MKVVTAAIIRKEGRILIARRAFGKQAGAWEFPGGKVEPGETEATCLAREILEELGIKVEIGSFIAESCYQYEQGQILLRAYETRWMSGEMRPTVHDQLEWVMVEELGRFQLLPADVPIAEALNRLAKQK